MRTARKVESVAGLLFACYVLAPAYIWVRWRQESRRQRSALRSARPAGALPAATPTRKATP